jgi:hypothetical protein
MVGNIMIQQMTQADCAVDERRCRLVRHRDVYCV